MNSTAEDIKTILEYYLDDSSGATLFDIFIGREPSEPNESITIFETQGFPPQLTYDRTERYDYPSVQIRIRANSYTEGYQQGLQVRDTLHGRANETWDDTYYSVIYCVNGPLLLDYDKNQRPRFILNFNIQRREIV